jgi:hypothetical protein
MGDDTSGVWLHVVGRDLDAERLNGITGVGGRPVHTIESDGLVAVVSPVDLDEFGEEALRRNLEDMAWLEATARAHHHVVAAAGALGPIIPARLATVYHDEPRVAAVLAERRDDFHAALDRVTGRTEFGVKAFAVPGAAMAAAVPPEDGGAGGAGTAYLRRRRAQLKASEAGEQAALGSAEAVHAALAAVAEAAGRHAPQDRKLSGEAGSMVLNGAYLVDARRADAFANAVTEQADRHPSIRLQLTGPWPPYSFATVDPPPAADNGEPPR